MCLVLSLFLDECVKFIETGNTIQVIQKQAEKDTSTQKTNTAWKISKQKQHYNNRENYTKQK